MTASSHTTPWGRKRETTPVSHPKSTMHSQRIDLVNDVNGALLQQQGASSGTGGRRASLVVSLRNPCRNETLKVGTWNIRSMLRAERLENIKREMEKNRLNLLGLTEVRSKETGDIMSDKFRVIHSGGKESQRGVALILDQRTGQSVSEVNCTSDRLMRVRLNGTP